MNRSFTVKSAGGLLTALATPCHVSQAFDPTNGTPECKRTEFRALWDTGATKTVITQRAVEACGLKPIRTIKPILLQGVDGYERSKAYTINIGLPDKITIYNLTVVAKDVVDVWWDVIIGMDIISAGNFSVKNVNSKTEWTFGIPSQQTNLCQRR